MSWRTFSACLISALLFLQGTALAEGPPEAKAGDGKIHGRLSAGGLYLHVADNLSTKGEARIDSLDDPPESHDRTTGIAILNLSYSPEGSQAEYYLGSPTTEFGRQGGGFKYRSDAGELDLFLFYSFFSKVWADPYLVNERREETGQDRHGAKLAWDRVLGGPYRAWGGIEHQDVHDDDIASRYDSLRRKSTLYDAGAGRHVTLPRGLDAVPEIEYQRGVFKGGAESYERVSVRLGLKRFSPSLILDSRAWVGWTRHDEKHPVFDKRRTERSYGAFLMATKPDVLGSRDNYLLAILFYGEGNSNITFFDRKAGAVFFGVGRNF